MGAKRRRDLREHRRTCGIQARRGAWKFRFFDWKRHARLGAGFGKAGGRRCPPVGLNSNGFSIRVQGGTKVFLIGVPEHASGRLHSAVWIEAAFWLEIFRGFPIEFTASIVLQTR